MRAFTNRFDAIAAFERELVRFGLDLPPGGLVADGNIHTLDDSSHHRRRNGAGRYWLREMPSGLLFGWGHSWFNNRGSFTWNSRNETTFTEADRKAIAEQRRKAVAERAEHYRLGAERADAVWAAGKPCSSHPYLTTKRVQSYGLRVDAQGRLLIPAYDFNGKLHAVQRIDAKGKKLWVYGANRNLPTHFVIGQLEGAEIIAVVEGYATGATVHEATGWPVVVAFDANGMGKVAKPLRAKYLRAHLVFAGDNDDSETGQKAAEAAARAAGGVAVMPPIVGTDWNDHAHGAIKDGVVVCRPHGVEDVGNRLLKAARIVTLPETVTLKQGKETLRRQVADFFKLAARWNNESVAREARVLAAEPGALWEAEKERRAEVEKAQKLKAEAQQRADAVWAEAAQDIEERKAKAAEKAEAAKAKPTKRNQASAEVAARKVQEAEERAAIEAADLADRADRAKNKKKAQDRIWKKARMVRAIKAEIENPPELLPQRPVYLVNVTMGLGKTHIARQFVEPLLRRDKRASASLAVPTHRLTNEQAAAMKAETGFTAAIWQGAKRPDPEHDDGRTMCVEPDLMKAAEEASVDQAAVCGACPSRKTCGYRRQQKQKARAWYFPHNLLYAEKPRAIPTPSVLVIDEAFHGPGMVEGSILAVSTLQVSLADVEDEADRQILEQANGKLLDAINAAAARVTGDDETTRLTRADLEAAGVTAQTAKEASRVAWGRKPKPKLKGSAADMVRELKALVGTFTPKVPRLWRMVEELLNSKHDIATGIEIKPNARLKGGDGFGLVVLLSYRREIHKSWHAPTLLLDGTARPEIGRRWFPELVALPEIHVEALHQKGTWVRDSFAKSRFEQSESVSEKRNAARAGNVEDLRRYIEVEASRFRGQAAKGTIDVLVATNQAIEIELKKGSLPANVAVEHFNNLRGSNAYENVRAVIVVGRTLPDAKTIHLRAERMAGHPLEPHDPLVQAVRWSICESELLQILARGRGIRRKEADPLDVQVLGEVPLPVPFDLVTTWGQAQPGPLEVLAARGLVLDCPPETKGYWPVVAAALPDLFKDVQAAKDWVKAEERRSQWNSSMNILIDDFHRETRLKLTARALSGEGQESRGRYSIPVLVDPARREALGAVVELADRKKPENRRKQAPGPKFAAVVGFLVDHGVVPRDPEMAAPLVSKMLPRAFPTPEEAREWLDDLPPEERGFDVPEAALARDWQPETAYFDGPGGELIEVPVFVAAETRHALARRLWLARPEPDPEGEQAIDHLAEMLALSGSSMTCRFWDRAP